MRVIASRSRSQRRDVGDVGLHCDGVSAEGLDLFDQLVGGGRGVGVVDAHVGAAAGEAVDKGSFALGRALGKAKRAMSEAAEEESRPKDRDSRPAVPAADVRVEKPVERIAEKSTPAAGAPKKAPVKTYAPAAKKPASEAPAPTPAAEDELLAPIENKPLKKPPARLLVRVVYPLTP